MLLFLFKVFENKLCLLLYLSGIKHPTPIPLHFSSSSGFSLSHRYNRSCMESDNLAYWIMYNLSSSAHTIYLPKEQLHELLSIKTYYVPCSCEFLPFFSSWPAPVLCEKSFWNNNDHKMGKGRCAISILMMSYDIRMLSVCKSVRETHKHISQIGSPNWTNVTIPKHCCSSTMWAPCWLAK